MNSVVIATNFLDTYATVGKAYYITNNGLRYLVPRFNKVSLLVEFLAGLCFECVMVRMKVENIDLRPL